MRILEAMEDFLSPRLRLLLPILDLLIAVAEESAKAAHKTYKEAKRRRVGATLRPGADTPLWNELAAAAATQLVRYGDKARLARILGVPRQRVHQYVRSKTACPDAERTLLLLAWVHARRNGRDLS